MKKNYRITRILFLLPLFFLSNLSFSQTIGFNIASGKKKVEIPFESFNNLIVIPVVINNSFPVKFVVDTGVRTAILTERAVSDALDLKYTRTIKLVGAAGGEGVEAHIVPNISINLPGVTGRGQALLVLEKDYLSLSSNLGTEVHGIIGHEIFSRFVVEIDYMKNILTLHEPQSFKPRKRFTAIPIKVEDTKPYITATVVQKDGCKVESKLLIDTGASHSLLIHSSSHRDLSLPEATITTTLGKGLGGNIIGEVGRIERLEIRDFVFNNLVASFPERDTYRDIIAETKRQGTIGGGLTNRFTVIFDYFNQKVYFMKNSEYRRKFNYNMSGIDLISGGKEYNDFIVSELIKDSAAEIAGIKVGDKIISINGIWKENLTLSQINHLFRSKEKKRIKMRILRNGEIIKKSFRLKSLI
ncbi:hypothetical protein BH23BAC1_BH23BAC1_08050 [soil metagenome]